MSGLRQKPQPDMTIAKTISLTVREDATEVMALDNSPLLDGLLYAAHLLSGTQRLELSSCRPCMPSLRHVFDKVSLAGLGNRARREIKRRRAI